MKDDTEIDARIRAASAAFSSAKRSFFASKMVPLDRKKLAYEGLILSILLYGSESWSLTSSLRSRLEIFHNRCIRSMCRVTRWHNWKFHLRMCSLENRLNVRPLGVYLARRRLGWLGKVARMDFEKRLPRKLLSSWIPNKRPVGRPIASYGSGLLADLKNAGIDVETWHYLAQTELEWEALYMDRNDIHVRPDNVIYVGEPPMMDPVQTRIPGKESYADVVSKGVILPKKESYAEVLLKTASLSSTFKTEKQSTFQETQEFHIDKNDTPLQSADAIQDHLTTVSSPKPDAQVSTLLPLISHPRVVRRSGRLAAKDAARGGRRLYSLKPHIE